MPTDNSDRIDDGSLEDALAALRAFGLDAYLTDDDDPALWAAALACHWAAVDDVALGVDDLHFGVGREPASGDEPTALSGMVSIDEWCFERIDDRRLRAVVCVAKPAVTWPSSGGVAAMVSGLALPAGFVLGRGSDTITISRPSRGVHTALVYRGQSAPFAGTGATRRWVRGDDGRWAETGEFTSRWLS